MSGSGETHGGAFAGTINPCLTGVNPATGQAPYGIPVMSPLAGHMADRG